MQVIEGYAADVVAVQEVRTVGERCQATELAEVRMSPDPCLRVVSA
jgi:hypothetical protein